MTFRLKQFPSQQIYVSAQTFTGYCLAHRIDFNRKLTYYYNEWGVLQSVHFSFSTLWVKPTKDLPFYSLEDFYTTKTTFPTSEFTKEGVLLC